MNLLKLAAMSLFSTWKALISSSAWPGFNWENVSVAVVTDWRGRCPYVKGFACHLFAASPYVEYKI